MPIRSDSEDRFPGLLIRPVQPEELGRLCAFAETTFRVAWQADNEPEPFEQYCRTQFHPDHLQAEMAVPGVEFYFVLLDEALVAYLKLHTRHSPPDWPHGPALQLVRIYVEQSAQSLGLGARLLAFVEDRARATGAGWVWLSVWQKSPRSIAFYQKNGYDIFGVETFWVGDDPQPDWLMCKPLDG